jgi:hypothetical protein
MRGSREAASIMISTEGVTGMLPWILSWRDSPPPRRGLRPGGEEPAMTPEFPQHRSRAACGSGQTPDGGRSPRTRQSSGDRPARLRHLPLATPAGAEADPIFNGARRASRDQLRGCPPAALEEAGGTEGRPQPPALAEAGPTASYPWQRLPRPTAWRARCPSSSHPPGPCRSRHSLAHSRDRHDSSTPRPIGRLSQPLPGL